MKQFITKVLVLSAMFSVTFQKFADASHLSEGTVNVIRAHEHYTYIRIHGEAAKAIYDNMTVPEVDNGGSDNFKGMAKYGFPSRAAGGKFSCEKTKIKKNDTDLLDYYTCYLSIDTSTGQVFGN